MMYSLIAVNMEAAAPSDFFLLSNIAKTSNYLIPCIRHCSYRFCLVISCVSPILSLNNWCIYWISFQTLCILLNQHTPLTYEEVTRVFLFV
jgi:hypothetical protein